MSRTLITRWIRCANPSPTPARGGGATQLQDGVYTSVVLRLLTWEPEHQAVVAVRALNGLTAGGKKAAVSDLVLNETYYALQYHFGVPKAKDLATMRDFPRSDEIECLGVAAEVIERPVLATSNPGFVDRMIHGGYRMQCGRMFSFEKASRKLPEASALK